MKSAGKNPEAGKYIIDTKSLTKKYAELCAVNKLDLRVRKGDIFGFLGHNGAGKTTTVNMLTTLLLPTSGTATVADFDIIKDSIEVRKRIGYLPENVQLYDSMTAYENLEYFARLSGIKEPRERIQEVLKFLEADSYQKKKISEFSKGMRQKIGIAQAILHEPQVLFLDEPTSGLDPFGVKQLRDTILRLNKERGMTIFMNTHLLSEVMKTCSTIGVLNHGKLIYSDSLEKTLKRFKDEASLEQVYLTIEESGRYGKQGHHRTP
jgi:ABC-2 type transport system ATP-binding protein